LPEDVGAQVKVTDPLVGASSPDTMQGVVDLSAPFRSQESAELSRKDLEDQIIDTQDAFM
jgi:hypothetical protein